MDYFITQKLVTPLLTRKGAKGASGCGLGKGGREASAGYREKLALQRKVFPIIAETEIKGKIKHCMIY